MAKLGGRTKQALARLLDRESDHKMIDSLYQRYDVPPLSTLNGPPTKLRKATHLTDTLGQRPDGDLLLQGLVEYAAGAASGMSPAFRRGRPESADLYESLDKDLGTTKPATAPREFKRPESSTPMPEPVFTPSPKRDVFVVKGRDSKAEAALEALLMALDLRIVTWDDAVRGCNVGTPSTIDIVRSGMRLADAVVVLMTPDDLGRVKPEFSQPHDDSREARLTGQARQNVVFEAGWAMGVDPAHVVIVKVGEVRALSDIDGLNYVNLTGDISSRKSLVGRLKNCDLAVDDSRESWRTAGEFSE